jgi:hypothetical protein
MPCRNGSAEGTTESKVSRVVAMIEAQDLHDLIDEQIFFASSRRRLPSMSLRFLYGFTHRASPS